MRLLTIITRLVALVGTLTACGGGAGEDSHSETRPPAVYSALEAQSSALHATWDSVSFTDPSTLPAGGTASFAGVVRLDVENGAGEISMDGALALQVAFASSSISGTASGFVDENNVSYSGGLILTNGAINRTANPTIEYTYSADLDGTLSGAGEVYDLTTDMSGDFHGVDYGAMSGAIAGNASSSFGTGYVFGEFIAEQ